MCRREEESDDPWMEEIEPVKPPEEVIEYLHSLTQLPVYEDNEDDYSDQDTMASKTNTTSHVQNMSDGLARTPKRGRREPAIRQTSLDRYFQQLPESAPIPKSSSHVFLDDDENGSFCRVDIDQKRVIFKRNETYLVNEHFCTIEKLFRKGIYIKAKCKVFMPLSEVTFLDTKVLVGLGMSHCYYHTDLHLNSLVDKRVKDSTQVPQSSLRYAAASEVKPNRNIVKRKDVDISFEFDTKKLPLIAIGNCVRSLDLFAGCGGFSIGMQQAGFKPTAACESDYHAAASYRVNHGSNCFVYEEDVAQFLKKVDEDDPVYPKRGDFEHIHASSPCGPFSKVSV